MLNSSAPSAVRDYVETLDNVGDGGTPAAASKTAAALCSNILLWEAVPNTLIDHFGNQFLTHKIYTNGSSA